MVKEKVSGVVGNKKEETRKRRMETRASKKLKIESANGVSSREAQPADAGFDKSVENGKGSGDKMKSSEDKKSEDGKGLGASEDSKMEHKEESGGLKVESQRVEEDGAGEVEKANVSDAVPEPDGGAGEVEKGNVSDAVPEPDGSTRAPSKKSIKQAQRRETWKTQKRLKKKEIQQKKQEGKKEKLLEHEERRASMTPEEIEAEKEAARRKRQERTNWFKQKKEKVKEAMTSGQNYVIDLEFCNLMTPQEIISLIQQVMYSYAANGKAQHPGRLTLTGIQGQIKEALEKISGYENWLIHKEEKSYMEVFQDRTADLVYLTADSPNLLEEISQSKIYIIGGLVDRNRHKSITLKKAEEQGIATAKIPVGDHLKMRGSQVLTVNQVMELMLGFQSHKDWKRALKEVVPLRRQAVQGGLDENSSPGETTRVDEKEENAESVKQDDGDDADE
ncbi:hypothetical protein R1sor_014347 [Riccia sorocarpa]|uniref:tRNA (guanine(9)-N(1))-methyltransferase n=1 Tax=Riccia sorocarpa TaxID=122646 RepID=A0ABD3H954_9MARC